MFFSDRCTGKNAVWQIAVYPNLIRKMQGKMPLHKEDRRSEKFFLSKTAFFYHRDKIEIQDRIASDI
jgi:hypothetical protein